jgi:hypothetical protein
MSTIGVRINSMSVDWQGKEQSGVKIEGSVHIDNKKGMNFSFHKDRLNILPLVEDKVVPELTKSTRTTIRNLLSAYTAAANHEGQFEVDMDDDEYTNSECALEE